MQILSQRNGNVQRSKKAPPSHGLKNAVPSVALGDTGLPDAIYRQLPPMFGSHATGQAWNVRRDYGSLAQLPI